MRVLFLPAPAIGHAFPLVPLAWAFQSAGHEAVFVTGGDGLTVANAGLPVLDALPGRTTGEMLVGFAEALPHLFAPLEGPPLETMNGRKPHIVAAWDPYVDAHVAVASRARPDLVVYDPIFAVGAVVAAVLGVPAVAHAVTITRYDADLVRELPGAVSLRRYGVDAPAVIRSVDLAPPSLAEGVAPDLLMGHVPYNGSGVLPDWLLDPPQRPRVAVTSGSTYGTRAFIGRAVRIAAADPEVEFVVTLGDGVPADVPDDLPPNLRLTGWVPLNALLRTCDAAVHHGGDGTLLTCCALGVPQLVLPNAPDEIVNAELLGARGAAHVLDEVDLDVDAVRELRSDEKLRRVAEELRAEITAMPSPARVVAQLTRNGI
jgi:UDP:flavonoid glycosyltransferase YjiC (YdhE family)